MDTKLYGADASFLLRSMQPEKSTVKGDWLLDIQQTNLYLLDFIISLPDKNNSS